MGWGRPKTSQAMAWGGFVPGHQGPFCLPVVLQIAPTSMSFVTRGTVWVSPSFSFGTLSNFQKTKNPQTASWEAMSSNPACKKEGGQKPPAAALGLHSWGQGHPLPTGQQDQGRKAEEKSPAEGPWEEKPSSWGG